MWDHIAFTYLQDNPKIEDFRFVEVCDAVVMEWERSPLGSCSLQSADK